MRKRFPSVETLTTVSFVYQLLYHIFNRIIFKKRQHVTNKHDAWNRVGEGGGVSTVCNNATIMKSISTRATSSTSGVKTYAQNNISLFFFFDKKVINVGKCQ